MFFLFLTQKSWQLVHYEFSWLNRKFSDFRLKGCVVKSDSPEALRRIKASLEVRGGPEGPKLLLTPLVWFTLMT